MDLLMISILVLICALLGLPFYVAATVLSVMHVEVSPKGLAKSQKNQNNYYIFGQISPSNNTWNVQCPVKDKSFWE